MKPKVEELCPKCAQMSSGVIIPEIADRKTLRVALTGDDTAKYQVGPNEYAIRIFLDEFDRSRTADMGELMFSSPSGRQLALKQFASINHTIGPIRLERKPQLFLVRLCRSRGPRRRRHPQGH